MKARWEQEVRGRLRAEIRHFVRSLSELVASDADEDKTRLIVTNFLRDGLGLDTSEGLVPDHGVRVGGRLVAYVEIKRCTQKLDMRQVQKYAVNEGVEWIILTNGQVWQVYHLTSGLPVIIDKVLQVDLPGSPKGLFYLSKESLERGLLDELWKIKAATSPRALSGILLSDTLLDAVRKELRRQTGYNGDLADLERIIREDVIRADAL